MPGVIRPYTLQDLLGALNGQSQGSSDTTTGAASTGFGVIAEADESIPATSVTDTATGLLVTSAPGWGGLTWGGFSWG